MKFDRRLFLKSSLVHIAASGLILPSKVQAFDRSRKTRPSVLQGATDQTKTQFSVVYDRNCEIALSAKNSRGVVTQADYHGIRTRGTHTLAITKAYFSNLIPNEKYELLISEKASGAAIESRTFKTLTPRSAKSRFVLASCLDHERHSADIWRDLVAQDPEMIFFVGDAVYADRKSPDGANGDTMWSKFCESRTILDIYFNQKLIPIIAVWDDHDFGWNDGHSDHPYLVEAQENFLHFFAQDPRYCDYMAIGPGVSSTIRYNGQQYVLMDCRSFRKKGASKDRYGHWGQDQEMWALKNLADFNGPSWIMTGSQVFPKSAVRESVAREHPTNLKEFQKVLSAIKSKVIFVSGDVHYSEILNLEKELLGYQSYELTSSSIHSFGAGLFSGNTRRMAYEGGRNYLLVDSTPKGNGCSFETNARSSSGKVKFSKKLTV